MKTVQVSTATNKQLDWLVAKCEGKNTTLIPPEYFQGGELVFSGEYDWANDCHIEVHYSTNWSQMGPIIERECISTFPIGAASTHPKNPDCWNAEIGMKDEVALGWGPTALIAAARCYVMSKLGEEVLVPDETSSSVPEEGT